MRKPRINKGFSAYSDSKLDLKTEVIITSITVNNPNFSLTAPQVVAAQAAATAYSEALVAAKNRGITEVSVKNQKREELEATLKDLADYVSLTASGNLTILISSGFDLAKQPQPSGPLQKPQIWKVMDGPLPGQLAIFTKRVIGVKLYSYQYTKDLLTDSSEWITATTTSTCKARISGLESTKKYWVRVIAMGIDEQMVYSDPVCRVVQ